MIVMNEHVAPCIHCKNNVCRGIFLKEYIEERAVEIADYIIENNYRGNNIERFVWVMRS